MARGGIPASPLPQRRGVDAMRLRMPQEGPWLTLRDHLVDRIPALDPERIDAMLAAGEFVGIDGMPCAPDAPFVPRSVVWVHRDLPDEVPVPFEVEVLHQDERIVVVDKPPFLATMPRGMHVTETVVTRLREQIGLPRLTPAHRLDRLTSGVLLLTTEQRWRGAYQQVFARGAAHKEYLAAAPVDPTLELPRRVAVHVDKPHGQWQAMVLPDRERALAEFGETCPPVTDVAVRYRNDLLAMIEQLLAEVVGRSTARQLAGIYVMLLSGATADARAIGDSKAAARAWRAAQALLDQAQADATPVPRRLRS